MVDMLQRPNLELRDDRIVEDMKPKDRGSAKRPNCATLVYTGVESKPLCEALGILEARLEPLCSCAGMSERLRYRHRSQVVSVAIHHWHITFHRNQAFQY